MAFKKETVTIKAPNMQVREFVIEGTEPLVIHRFSTKVKDGMIAKMEAGKAGASTKNREAKSTDETYEAARYRSPEGWDGCHAGAFRNAMISACRLVGATMTLAKLSIFIEADGRDAEEPQIPLVRIYGASVKQEDRALTQTGVSYVTVRAAYHDWHIRLRIRWDADQFTVQDVTNLLYRVGQQVGIGEGRPDSKKSAGMGWGLFRVLSPEEAESYESDNG